MPVEALVSEWVQVALSQQRAETTAVRYLPPVLSMVDTKLQLAKGVLWEELLWLHPGVLLAG